MSLNAMTARETESPGTTRRDREIVIGEEKPYTERMHADCPRIVKIPLSIPRYEKKPELLSFAPATLPVIGASIKET